MQHLAPRQPITCQVVRPATSNQTSRARFCAAVAGGGRGYPAVFVGRQSLLAFWSCKSDDLFYVLRCLGALLFRHISGLGLGERGWDGEAVCLLGCGAFVGLALITQSPG